MAGFLGMDIEAVQALSQMMNTKADEIQQIMGQLTNSLQGAQWVGTDRERFLSDWQGTHVQHLSTVVQGLHDAAQKAAQNAQEQSSTSA